MRSGCVALYLRISDDDKFIWGETGESGSITNQRNVLNHFINEDSDLINHPIKEFCDDGYTGVNFKRPGMQALLKEIRENKIYCIIVKDFSRFGRNYIEVGDYLEQIFPFLGIRFISVIDQYDSDKSTGGIEVGFKTLMHDLYSRDLSKKIKSVKKIHQEKGIYSGGGIPFGYKNNPDKKGGYVIDLEAAKVIDKIFGLAVQGNTTGVIATILNEKNIPTPGAYSHRKGITHYSLKNPKNNFWTATQVKEIIENEVYIGTYICRKVVTIRAREVQRVSSDEHQKFPNAHEAIVTIDTFRQAQKVINRRGKRGKYKTDDESYVLKGKVKCGSCGYSLNRITRVKKPYYCCRMGKSCGDGVKIEEAILNQIVLESLQQLILVIQKQQEQDGQERKKVITVLSSLKDEKRILDMKVERCRNDKLFFYRAYKEGKQTKKEFIKNQKTAEAMMKQHLFKLKSVESKIAALQVDTVGSVRSDTIEQHLDVSTLTRPLVTEFIDRIDIYDPDRVQIKWNFCPPFNKINANVEKS